MKRKIFFGAFLVLAACLSYAFTIHGTTFEASLGAGLLGPGGIDASWDSDFPADLTISENTDPSLLIRGTFECFFTKNIAVGLIAGYTPIIFHNDFDYTDNGTTYHIGTNAVSIVDYCLGLVGKIPLSELVSIRSGLYAGGVSTFSAVKAAQESGVAIDGCLGLDVYCFRSVYAFAEVGFLYQPYGGNDFAWIRSDQILYCVIGLGF